MKALFAGELIKVIGWRRTRVALLLCLLGPPAAIAAINAQQNLPKDTLFGRYVGSSGSAAALLILGFAGQWLLPVLVSVVAGDVFASEDRCGTWKTMLTRSSGRRQIFWAKALAATVWSLAATSLFALASVLAGLVLVGDQPLIGLSGQGIPGSHALLLVLAAWASVLAPVLGFAGLALLASVLSRSTTVGIGAPAVLGLALQLLSLLDGPTWFQRALPTTSFTSWHGLFTLPGTGEPVAIGIAVSAGWGVVGVVAAYAFMVRREFAT